MAETKFLRPIMKGVVPVLKDYFDSVRGEACIVTEYIITHLLTHEPALNKEQTDLIMMLRGNLTLGWNSNMASPIKALAEAEGLLVDWLFDDAQDFLK